MDQSDIENRLKAYILEDFLPGGDPSQLTSQTPLMATGILDSIATLRLVTFMEEEFGVSLEAHEADADNLGSIEQIARLVVGKMR